jgi:hypothetical protein
LREGDNAKRNDASGPKTIGEPVPIVVSKSLC